MLFATDRPLPSPCLLIPTQSLVLPGRQRENTPYTVSPGSSGLDDKLADRCADATMRHSHISGGRAFSHSHDVQSIASGSVSAECGEFLGTLLVGAWPASDGCRTTSWEVVVKGREQHNRT